MDMSMLEKFNEMFDLEGLKEDVKNSSSTEFVEVPYGKYDVSIASMEMGLTSEQSKNPNSPMLKVRFKINDDMEGGIYKGNSIFYNQVLTSGFGIHKANELLQSLQSPVEVKFENFVQYAEMIDAIFFNLRNENASYSLNYTYDLKNDKKWAKFEIEERF